MQQKNLIAFVVLSVLVLISWHLLMGWLAPPVKHKGLESVQWEKWPRRTQNEYAATRLLTTPATAWSGLDGAVRLATDLSLLPSLPQTEQPAPVAVQLPDERLWGGLPAGLPGAFFPASPGLGDACRLATHVALTNWASAPRPQPVAHRAPSFELGDDTFNLQVTLTPRGAGVEQVVLTHFQDANRLGLPVESGGKPVPLALIPKKANEAEPSFRLFRYPDPNADPSKDNENTRYVTDLGDVDWVVKSVHNEKDDEVRTAEFTCEVPGQNVVLTKTYTLRKGDYHLGLTIRMQQKQPNGQPVPFRYLLEGPHGLPIEGEWYTPVYHNALIGYGVGNGLSRNLQDAQSISQKGGGDAITSGPLRYAAVATQYFASAVAVDQTDDQSAEAQAKGKNILARIRPQPFPNRFMPQPHQRFLDDITVDLISQKVEIPHNAAVEHRFLLYNGPVKVAQLAYLEGSGAIGPELEKIYDNQLHLNTMTDYGWTGWWSQLLVACTNVMHWLLAHILWVLNALHIPWSYGLSIMFLTVVVRGIMFPLSRRQTGATVRMQEKMAQLKKDLAPELRKLEEKYRDDPWKKRQAEHELYQKHGVNPAAMLSSCWLMFAQLPIFLGLYYALQESILFRLKPFLWVPNLSAPDMLIYWGEHIPYISDWSNLGSFPYLGPFFNLLPVVWVVLMFFQQKMMTPPAADEQQEMQQKMMKFMLVAFFYFFYKVPAGLCIYYIGSMLWTLGERKLLPKAQTAAGPAPAPQSNGRRATSPPAGASRSRSRRVQEEKGNGTMKRMRDLWAEVLKQAKKK